MIREDSPKTHASSMDDGFMTQAAQTPVAMDNFNLFSNNNVAEYWKEGEDSWKSGLSIYDEERNMIDFKTIGEISDPGTAFVCVGYDNDFVAAVDEILPWVSFYMQRDWKPKIIISRSG